MGSIYCINDLCDLILLFLRTMILLPLIFSCSKHTFRIFWGCHRCKSFVCSDARQSLHPRRESRNYHSALKSGILLAKTCIFYLPARVGCGIGCKKTVGLHPIIICRSNGRRCRIRTNWFSIRTALFKIVHRTLPGSFLRWNSIFTGFPLFFLFRTSFTSKPGVPLSFICWPSLCRKGFLSGISSESEGL